MAEMDGKNHRENDMQCKRQVKSNHSHVILSATWLSLSQKLIIDKLVDSNLQVIVTGNKMAKTKNSCYSEGKVKDPAG